MFLSMNWISDFVDLSGLDKKALIHRFTLSTAEVEDVYEKGADISGVIVAEIVSVENHPTSKKLHLLKVNTGKAVLDIVCGAPNVRVGLRVPLAVDGSVVSGHRITPATVGGFTSYGMCCSEAELGISADNSGLMEITDDIPLGTDLKSVYAIDDIVFEVDNKSLTNRPDLWGHYGIAREFATLTGRPLKAAPSVDLALYNELPRVPVEVRDDFCFRYSAIRVENVSAHVSPVNMRIRLFYCGSRAINLLADLTNYVMMELGQPMHAFDQRRVNSVVVKRFPEAFSFKTLDGQERKIDDTMLMICTGDETPVAVAGVMGGLESEIEDDTSSLLLESATFDGVSIRKTSSKLGLRTDASIRYEKFLDPENCEKATARFLWLLSSIDSGVRVTSAYSDCYRKQYEPIVIEMDETYVDRYTGIKISKEEILRTLTSLGFGVEVNGTRYTVTVPSWRRTKDVTIKADLIEEITRIYGYDNFEIKTTKSPLFPVRKTVQKSYEDKMKDLLVSMHALHEVHSYIWCDAAKWKELAIDLPDNVKVINAQTPDHAVLRDSMIPTLLSFASENKDFSDSYGIFEIGHTVSGYRDDGMCDERKKLGIVLFSKTESEEELYLSLCDIATDIFRILLHRSPDFKVASGDTDKNWLHPVNTAWISLDEKPLGLVGVPHPLTKEKIDKKASVAFLEIDTGIFASLSRVEPHYEEPSRFPAIDIDLSFAMNASDIDYGELSSAFRKAGGALLRDISVVDVFDGESGASVTFRYAFSSPERTLSKAELEDNINAIISVMADRGISLKM